MTDKLTAVAECVNDFAQVETALNTLKTQFDTLTASINVAHEMGVGRPSEYLRIVNMLDDAKGRTSAALERVIAAHEKCTAIAKREGCDVVLPAGYAIQPFSGGDR